MFRAPSAILVGMELPRCCTSGCTSAQQKPDVRHLRAGFTTAITAATSLAWPLVFHNRPVGAEIAIIQTVLGNQSYFHCHALLVKELCRLCLRHYLCFMADILNIVFAIRHT